MLRLWLNPIRPSICVALFDKACAQQSWLGRSQAIWPSELAIRGDASALSALLDQLLSSRPISAKKFLPAPSQVSIILPDYVARYELLPWTPSLMQADELRQFAIERFEIANQSVREGWVVQAEWKQKGANTLAYALPHSLLDALRQIVNKHELCLNRIMPLSALAHYGRLGLSQHNELRILHTSSSISSLFYLNGRLTAYMMEVVRGCAADSLHRLLSRLRMSEFTTEIKLHQLTMIGIDPIHLKELIDTNSPTQVRTLSALHWRKWR